MVGLPVARWRGGHVGQDDVGRAAEHVDQRSGAPGIEEVELHESTPGMDSIEKVDADDPPFASALPTAWPRPGTIRRAPRRDR